VGKREGGELQKGGVVLWGGVKGKSVHNRSVHHGIKNPKKLAASDDAGVVLKER